jgi:hypothetical protein
LLAHCSHTINSFFYGSVQEKLTVHATNTATHTRLAFSEYRRTFPSAVPSALPDGRSRRTLPSFYTAALLAARASLHDAKRKIGVFGLFIGVLFLEIRDPEMPL